MSIIRDRSLADEGIRKIEWVKDFMPVLSDLEKRFIKEQPLKGKKIALSIHLEAKTAYLALVLRSAGAIVSATGSNVLSTKDDVSAGLDKLGIEINAWHGATDQEYVNHLKQTLSIKPDIVIDDGGDLINLLHGECKEYAVNVIGGAEETTTGIHRLHARAAENKLDFPMIAVNDADCKHLFDNRHGTGQSTWDGIMYATNNIIASKVVVVAGFGYCGSGIALRAKGLGARVIVTEIDPVRALEAAMEGYEVMKMDDAAAIGDIFVTVTGCKDVIVKHHFEKMKNNVLVANAGHFDVEFNKQHLRELSESVTERKHFIDGYKLKNGNTINALADGRLVNIVAGNGHPAEIMDMSFALQALSAVYLVQNEGKLKPSVINVPKEIDREVAMMKVEAMNLGLDTLTAEQIEYLSSSEA